MGIMQLKKYSFSNRFYMLLCLVRTRLFYPGARLIRFPFDIRNEKNIIIGKGFTSGRNCRIEVCGEDLSPEEKCLRIGGNVQINDYVHIAACKEVIIGNHVLIASKVFISDINHGDYQSESDFDLSIPPEKHPLSSEPIRIGDFVWLGESVCVLSGVTIGEHSVIGALSCVTKSIPPYSIAVGNPARVIKTYNCETRHWERL